VVLITPATYSVRVDSLLDTVAGLPVHPLVVHAAVVLVPLAALGAILMAFWRSFSRRFGVIVVIAAGVAAGASFIARGSGEQLAERVGEPEQHAELGEVLPLIALALFVLVLVFWLFDRGVPANRTRPVWLIALAALLVVASVVAVFWTVRTGHTGAEATWSAVIENTRPPG
jgi:uncharacterized membrane protein